MAQSKAELSAKLDVLNVPHDTDKETAAQLQAKLDAAIKKAEAGIEPNPSPMDDGSNDVASTDFPIMKQLGIPPLPEIVPMAMGNDMYGKAINQIIRHLRALHNQD